MNDAAFREALDVLVSNLLEAHGYAMSAVGETEGRAGAKALLAADSALTDFVLALYAERQGEGVDATVLSFAYDRLERTAMMLHAPSRGCWDAFGTGDRVRVTKVEEGQ